MRLLLVLAFLLLGACAKKGVLDEGPSIASIPQGCTLYGTPGWHQFPDRALQLVDAYSCGQREGKVCWYYAAQNTSSTAVKCE